MTSKPREKAAKNDGRLELAELLLLRERLKAENETELLQRIEVCEKPLVMRCLTCSARKEVRQQCKRRWCPCCARRLAAARAVETEYIVARMRWPLFVTLTMRHGSTIDSSDIRRLRRAFGKLRHRKIWKSRTRGGVASVELTGEGRQWHPHLHAVIDCRWLAIKQPPPRARATQEEWRLACTAASAELGEAWAKLLGQETASVRIKRARAGTIAREVMKYTVKAQDLIESEVPIGDLIRSMDRTRLMTTFGEAHGQKVSGIRAQAKAYAATLKAEWRESMQDSDCCPAMELMPEDLATNERLTARLFSDRMIQCEPETRKRAIAQAIALSRE